MGEMGLFLRKVRRRRGASLTAISTRMKGELSSSALQLIETGKRRLIPKWLPLIEGGYALEESEKRELSRLLENEENEQEDSQEAELLQKILALPDKIRNRLRQALDAYECMLTKFIVIRESEKLKRCLIQKVEEDKKKAGDD